LSSNDQKETKLRTNAPEEYHLDKFGGAPALLLLRGEDGPAAVSSTSSFSSVVLEGDTELGTI
jgi:hypothetical protein